MQEGAGQIYASGNSINALSNGRGLITRGTLQSLCLDYNEREKRVAHLAIDTLTCLPLRAGFPHKPSTGMMARK